MGATLAAHLVEIVSDQSFAEYCQQHIVTPLQHVNASFELVNADRSRIARQYFGKRQKELPLYSHNFYPIGGLRISNEALSQFLVEIIRGYHGEGKLLNKESYATLLSGQFPTGQLPASFPTNETNQGIFWTHRNQLIGHTGGGLGASAFLFFDTETGIGRILVTNAEIVARKKYVQQFLELWTAMDEFW